MPNTLPTMPTSQFPNTPWLVVALVDEGGAIIFESILVRCAGPDGHE
jgi:hypothetical protein